MVVKIGANEAGYSFFKGRLSVACDPKSRINLADISDGRGSIVIEGSGNVVEFLDGSTFNGSMVVRGNNNKILIGRHCSIRGQILVKGSGQTVSVGEHTSFQSVYMLCQEGCDIIIGRWCMFSRDIEVRTTDAHSVVDIESGLRINKPASVKIGDHVWVSVGCLISKGVNIPDDCIVGAHSFVNSSFVETGTVLAGSPAKIAKHGVTWHRSRKEEFSKEELNLWRWEILPDAQQ